MKGKLLLLTACVAFFGACGGPERAPRQPILGVDMSHPKDANPHDVTTGTTAERFLVDFEKKLIAAHQNASGAVAVFPALTYNQDRQESVVNGLGERLAELTTIALENADIPVLAGSNLVDSLRAAKHPVSSYDSVAGAWRLAEALGATYVVTGKVNRRVFDRLKRDESLDIDWLCRKVQGGDIVARYNRELQGGTLANELMRYYQLESEWQRLVLRERSGSTAGQ